MVDHHAEVALEHLVDGSSFQAPEQIGIIAGQPSRQDVPREDHGPAVRCTDPVYDYDVLAGLEVQPLGLIGRGSLRSGRALERARLHAGSADRVGHSEVRVQVVRHAGAVCDEGPRAPGPADEPLVLERAQGLAQGGPGDA